MKRKILILDTSMLCIWLNVPGKDNETINGETYDSERVNNILSSEIENGTILVMPLASIIETGNHISHINGDKYDLGHRFAELIRKTAEEEQPWAAFTNQKVLWEKDGLIKLSERWRDTVISGQSIGDASIVEVADHYNTMGIYNVEIFTADQGLKAYEPKEPAKNTFGKPRRRH